MERDELLILFVSEMPSVLLAWRAGSLQSTIRQVSMALRSV